MSCPDVISGILSIRSILDQSIQLFDDTSANGTLPESLCTVRCRIPIIMNIYQKLKGRLEPVHLLFPRDVQGPLKMIIDRCGGRAAMMRSLLQFIHDGNETWERRYFDAIRIFGNITTIEAFMKTIAEDTLLILPDTSEYSEPRVEVQQIIDEMRLLRAFSFQMSWGLCFGRAPFLSPELFVGRESELDEIKYLESDRRSQEVHRIIIGGARGVGKTQLAIEYAKRSSEVYESCFWLNATSESTLKQSIQDMADLIFRPKNLQNLNEEAIIRRVHEWLSNVTNTRWLIVFDGYGGFENFDIEKVLPPAPHGTVIVTTTKPDLISGQRLQLSPLQNTEDCVKIVETRSERKIFQNSMSWITNTSDCLLLIFQFIRT